MNDNVDGNTGDSNDMDLLLFVLYAEGKRLLIQCPAQGSDGEHQEEPFLSVRDDLQPWNHCHDDDGGGESGGERRNGGQCLPMTKRGCGDDGQLGKKSVTDDDRGSCLQPPPP